jgi:hypothetical protein
MAGVLLFGGVLFQSTAQGQGKGPPKGPGPLKPPKEIKLVLPDLRLTGVTVGTTVMTVKVTNQCKGQSAQTRLRLHIYGGPQKGSTGGDILEADVPPLKAGEVTAVTFDLKAYASKFSTYGDKYYRLEVDPYGKIKEVVENNNWVEKGAGPFPDAWNVCDK